VARASKEKYVYDFAAGQLCSAAYWVASQADAICQKQKQWLALSCNGIYSFLVKSQAEH
jgi:hypothetical protein